MSDTTELTFMAMKAFVGFVEECIKRCVEFALILQ